MTTELRQPAPELQLSVRQSWQRFLDVYEPLRPELYRYCRYLTRSPWDAEDLVQDTLGRAFVTLGRLFREPPNPRAWLFRVASNLWIDRKRGQREEPLHAEPAAHVDPRGAREAAGTLMARLSPQERAAVVLKDVFEFSLEEVAEALLTSVGTVKTALHRGRGKLEATVAESAGERESPAARATLDAFCAAFNARDMDRLTALLLDTSVVEIAGLVTEYGPDAARDPYTGSFTGSLAPITRDERGGVGERYLEGYVPGPPRAEIREYRGELVLLFFCAHVDGDAVRSVVRVVTDGDRVARLVNYFFTPEVVAEICGELGVPCRSNGYRYW